MNNTGNLAYSDPTLPLLIVFVKVVALLKLE